MAIPEGYKTVEQIAVAEDEPLNRVHTAIRRLGVLQVVFPDDRRRRYYSPEDVKRIREWLKQN